MRSKIKLLELRPGSWGGGHLVACVSGSPSLARSSSGGSASASPSSAARLTAPSRRSCTFGGLWQPARPFRRAPPPVPPVPTVQVARGVLTPAVRDMKPSSRATGTRCSTRSPSTRVVRACRAAGPTSGQRARPAQRPEEPDAGSDRELRRRQQPTAPPAGHRGRHRPEPLHAVGEPPVPRSTNGTGRPRRRSRTGYQLFTGQTVCGSPSGNGGDPIVVYDQFAHRWIASQLAYPNYPSPGRSTSASPTRRRTTRRAPGARTSSSPCSRS